MRAIDISQKYEDSSHILFSKITPGISFLVHLVYVKKGERSLGRQTCGQIDSYYTEEEGSGVNNGSFQMELNGFMRATRLVCLFLRKLCRHQIAALCHCSNYELAKRVTGGL